MKKKMMALFALVAAVCLTGYYVSGTYAKYVSTISGTTDDARVAKWSFEINGQEAVATKTFTFDLFKTIKDTGDAQEDDVKTGSAIIAPGTEGSFQLSLENKSEVNAMVKIDYTVTNANEIPIEFSVDKENWAKELTDLGEEELKMENSKEITIYWRWSFDGAGEERQKNWSDKDDTADTTLGQVGTATVQVKADITVTQKD